jgi:hypothetical protein
LFRIETDAQKADWFDAATEEFLAFDDDKLMKDIIPKLTKRIMALQKSRSDAEASGIPGRRPYSIPE